MDERITSSDGNLPIPPPQPPQVNLPRNKITQASDYLQDNSRIGMMRTHYDKHRRYAELYPQAIFNSLVNMYSSLFLTTWPDFKRFMDHFPPPLGVQPWVYAARIYLSAWLHDLYVSNREAVKKLSPLAFSEHFTHEEVYYSFEYDEFLVRLNASIRPTHVKGIMEDTLYIPIIHNNPNWATENPFVVTYYIQNYDCVSGLIGIMKDRKRWKISSLVTDTLGRPSWLFDWHTDNRCCAWFPAEGNFTMDDVTIAYIIGVACTPKLGPRDVDEWQTFPNATVPNVINTDNYDRIVERRFYGAYEVRTLEQRQVTICTTTTGTPAPGTKRPRLTSGVSMTSKSATTMTGTEPTETSSSGDQQMEGVEQLIPQLQLIDWTYYYLVVLNLDIHTRNGALKMLAHN